MASPPLFHLFLTPQFKLKWYMYLATKPTISQVLHSKESELQKCGILGCTSLITLQVSGVGQTELLYCSKRLQCYIFSAFLLVSTFSFLCYSLPSILTSLHSIEKVTKHPPLTGSGKISWMIMRNEIRKKGDYLLDKEIADIMFLIKSLKSPSGHFNIADFISFNNSNTRSSSYLKLHHSVSKSNIHSHFYFHRIPRQWNSLPLIDTSLSIPTIRARLRQHFWTHFIANFDCHNLCSYHYLCPCLNCSKLPVKMQFTHLM